MQRRPRRRSSIVNKRQSRSEPEKRPGAYSYEASSSTGRLPDPAAQPSSEAASSQQQGMPPSRFPSSLSPVEQVTPLLHPVTNSRSTTSAAAHTAPPTAHRTQTQTQQQQASITHPHGILLPEVSQEHLPATTSAPPVTPSPPPEPATPTSPSTLNTWVDSLFVADSPP